MRSIVLAVLLTTAATSCVNMRATKVRGPDGSDNWYHLACGNNEVMCLQDAGELCPSGYEVADKSSEVSGATAAWNTAYVQRRKTMLIRCNDSARY